MATEIDTTKKKKKKTKQTTTLKHFWNSFTQFNKTFRLYIWLHSDAMLLDTCSTNSIRLESFPCQLLLQCHPSLKSNECQRGKREKVNCSKLKYNANIRSECVKFISLIFRVHFSHSHSNRERWICSFKLFWRAMLRSI